MQFNKELLDALLPHVVTLVAAFGGAWFAFVWQNRAEKRKESENNYAAILLIQATFYRYYSVIAELHAHLISMPDDTKLRKIDFVKSFPEINYSNLSLILQTKDPDLFEHIAQMHRNCASAIDSVEVWNAQYLTVTLESKIEHIQENTCTLSTDPRKYALFQDYTKIMRRDVSQETLTKILALDKSIKLFIKTYFPKKHALQLDFVEN